ncbi:uncharacterized protein LOC109607713 isoform X2 [Aethina tumida]|uniref:uncharacterized protein LOC109607713 isoform X2 n=1 Tax=Aethina tumida TaxID=116153 RepID=UPI00096B008F|nr:uncharacterized protein LOC109607713 isoform X2 [Aethina tumida]
MNGKTANDDKQSANNAEFSPVKLPQSPAAGALQKNLTGSPRVARDIVADLYNNIQKWNDFHIKGSTIVKKIVAVKSESQENYTIELEEYTKALFEVMTSLIKTTVLENIGHAKDKHEAMFYAASWTHQDYITKRIDMKLECLVVETGHRAYH